MQDQQDTNTDIQVMNGNNAIQPFKTVISETASPLSEILMASIRKVQADPGYINQAKEIRDNVRELVNLARVEVDAIRELRKLK